MIADTAKVSLFDGTHAPAMEVYPGREVLSVGHRRLDKAQVLGRRVESRDDVICLILSNGQKLTGSRDQKVAVFKPKSVQFKELADVNIGDHLRGERSGVPVVVSVIGLAFDHRPVRLVGFQLEQKKNFVAQGILCR